MKIGYPCINHTLECQGDKTFRLKSYSEKRLEETVENNLNCLLRILEFNRRHSILFFRISSDLVPFASHPVCKYPWQKRFEGKFKSIGAFIKKSRMRISMHPDQFTLINSIEPEIFERSQKELLYHAQVLDLLGLDQTAKIQIHLGGAYGDKGKSRQRFSERYRGLPAPIRKRLVIENDDRIFTLEDCLRVSSGCGVPVLFDSFHHSLNSSGEGVGEALKKISATWKKKDGLPMVDYSSGQPGARRGRHAEHIKINDFRNFLKHTRPYDFDIMLEIKDKEKSALKAIEAAKSDPRCASCGHAAGGNKVYLNSKSSRVRSVPSRSLMRDSWRMGS